MAGDDEGTSGDFEIIAGTYEHFLVGYIVEERKLPNGEKEFFVTQSFTNNSHTGNITSLTTVGKYLVSGSTDEIIRLINLESRVEHGILQQQEGTITHLTSFDDSFLFSGSEDGTICVWKSGSWLCEKTLRAHKGGVLQLSVHPSGKMALSVGRDRTLKTWNLIKGRIGFVTNLKGMPEAVQWSPRGTFYVVSVENRVDAYSTQTAKVEYTFNFNKRVSKIVFLEDDTFIVLGDKEEVEVHNTKLGQKLSSFAAHKNRVKDALYLRGRHILITASNDGFIKLWRLTEDGKSCSLLKAIDTSCRITCLAAYSKED